MSDLLYFNGVTPSGSYALAPMSAETLRDSIIGADAQHDPNERDELERRRRRDEKRRLEHTLFRLLALKWKALVDEPDSDQVQQARRETEKALRSMVIDQYQEKATNAQFAGLRILLDQIPSLPEAEREALLDRLDVGYPMLFDGDGELSLVDFRAVANLDRRQALRRDLEAKITLPELSEAAFALEAADRKYQAYEQQIVRLQTAADTDRDTTIESLSYGETQVAEVDLAAFAETLDSAADVLVALNDKLSATRNKLAEYADLGVREGINATNLAEAGWGIILPARHPQTDAILEALKPLLEHRKQQAGDNYKVYTHKNGWRPNDDHRKFLHRYGGHATRPVDPQAVPYYLLLVADPEQISFESQYQLDVQYAVGRIYFDDPAEYRRYALSVVKAETEAAALPPKVSLVGVQNANDRATEQSTEHLITPLAENLRRGDLKDQVTVDVLKGPAANKAGLLARLGGAETPALLFTASHGLEIPADDPDQHQLQGALVSSDWGGPGTALGPDDYVAGGDLSAEANLLGSMVFLFACFGGGTPRYDQFHRLKQSNAPAEQLASENFLAELPRRLLNRPQGGALAVIAHIDRAWNVSFLDHKQASHVVLYQSTLESLLKGNPVGLAVEYFNETYAATATELTQLIEAYDQGVDVDPFDLVGQWTNHNDARGFVIIGDPAARLNLARPDQATSRASLADTSSLAFSTAASTPASGGAADPPPLVVGLDAADWAATPPAVQTMLRRALVHIAELEQYLQDAPRFSSTTPPSDVVDTSASTD